MGNGIDFEKMLENPAQVQAQPDNMVKQMLDVLNNIYTEQHKQRKQLSGLKQDMIEVYNEILELGDNVEGDSSVPVKSSSPSRSEQGKESSEHTPKGEYSKSGLTEEEEEELTNEDKVQKLLKQNIPQVQIAKQLDVSEALVSRYKKRLEESKAGVEDIENTHSEEA